MAVKTLERGVSGIPKAFARHNYAVSPSNWPNGVPKFTSLDKIKDIAARLRKPVANIGKGTLGLAPLPLAGEALLNLSDS